MPVYIQYILNTLKTSQILEREYKMLTYILHTVYNTDSGIKAPLPHTIKRVLAPARLCCPPPTQGTKPEAHAS